MPAISAKPVGQSRRRYHCETCLLPLEGRHVSAYGYADPGDKPFTIRMCWTCATDSEDDVIRRAALEGGPDASD